MSHPGRDAHLFAWVDSARETDDLLVDLEIYGAEIVHRDDSRPLISIRLDHGFSLQAATVILAVLWAHGIRRIWKSPGEWTTYGDRTAADWGLPESEPEEFRLT